MGETDALRLRLGGVVRGNRGGYHQETLYKCMELSNNKILLKDVLKNKEKRYFLKGSLIHELN